MPFASDPILQPRQKLTAETLIQVPPEWLQRAYQHYGRARKFDLDMQYWIQEYPNLLDLIHVANGPLLEALPIPGTTLEDGKTPALVTVSLMPRTLELLRASRQKPGPKSNRTFVTIEGREIDLRNRCNFDLFHAHIEDVENVAESYLHQLRNETTKGQRRACMCQLHRVLLLKGPELRRDLLGSILLRLGMSLPPDFWHLPSERVPESTKAYLHTLEPGEAHVSR